MDAKKITVGPGAQFRTDISLDDYFELLDLLGAIFEALSDAQGPHELLARMRTAATVFREKHEMSGSSLEDVYHARLAYNLPAHYRRQSRATTPLLPPQTEGRTPRDWNDSNSGGHGGKKR